MSGVSVFACGAARQERWRLGRLVSASFPVAIAGWRMENAVDGGMPAVVAGIFSRAIAGAARASFPGSEKGGAAAEDWEQRGAVHIRRLREKSFTERLLGRPGQGALISTCDASEIAKAFDDSSFPWWLQGQVIFLSPPKGPLPDLGFADVEKALSADWLTADLSGTGVTGVVRPGVDGDIAGIAIADAAEREAVLGALAGECAAAGAQWEMVSEAGFARRLAGPD